MRSVFLERKALEGYTTGTLSLDSGLTLATLERPWRDNRPFDSCIPDGVYYARPYTSPKFGQSYILSGGTVSEFKSQDHQRYAILIHPANRVHQLAGCIAVGMDLKGDFLHKSRQGCKLLFDELNGDDATIFISGVDSWS